MSHRKKIGLIILLLFCLLSLGCSPVQKIDPVQEVRPTPTSPPQSVPAIADWYEYTYTTQDYLQTTYTVYLDINDGIEIKAGLHTWNNNAMQEQHCTNIHHDSYLTVSVLNATQVEIGGTFNTADGGYSRETYSIQRGGFLTHTYVDSEGHFSTFTLEPSTASDF